MLLDIFNNFHIIHGILLVVAAIGFFLFWARTRFWLPKYAHILAIIALALGAWMAATVSDNAPISKQGPLAKTLLALALADNGLLLFRVLRWTACRLRKPFHFNITVSPLPTARRSDR